MTDIKSKNSYFVIVKQVYEEMLFPRPEKLRKKCLGGEISTFILDHPPL